MTTIIDFAKHNLLILKDYLEKCLPGVFETDGVMEAYNNYASITLPMTKQMKIDDLTDVLENNLSVNILYAIEDSQEKRIEVMAYSLPMTDKMFSIKMFSFQYGLISSIEVSFFKSFDVMFYSLKNKLQNKPSDWKVLEEIHPAKFFSHFS